MIMSEDCFDSEVIQLISDLGLVQIGSPEYREWLAIWTQSHYTRFWFCERWQKEMDERRRRRQALQRSLYNRNKPYSRYVHSSLSYQTAISWSSSD